MFDPKKRKSEEQLRDALEALDQLSFSYGKITDKAQRSNALARMAYYRTLIPVLRAGGTVDDLQRERTIEAAIENGLPVPDFSKRVPTPLQRSFGKFLATGDATEYRNTAAQSGVGTVTNSEGSAGGYFVPMEFDANLTLALAQTDDLLNPDNVMLDQGGDMSGRSKSFAGWDLSTLASVKVNENTLHSFTNFPASTKTDIATDMHRADLVESMEFDQDTYFTSTELMARAFGVAFARGIGAEVAAVLVAGAADSGITIRDTVNTSPFDYDNFAKLFYSLNRVYRNSPKCAWAMNEQTIEKLRLAKDSMLRPLINTADGVETLFGKKILSCPSIPGLLQDSGIAPGKVILGDMSHFIVRLSQTSISANRERFAESGQILYTARKRQGSAVLDPSSGTSPAIVFGTITA